MRVNLSAFGYTDPARCERECAKSVNPATCMIKCVGLEMPPRVICPAPTVCPTPEPCPTCPTCATCPEPEATGSDDSMLPLLIIAAGILYFWSR